MQWSETVKCWSQNKTWDHKIFFFFLSGRVIASLLKQTENVLPVQIREPQSTFETVTQHTEVTTDLQEVADSFTNCMSMAIKKCHCFSPDRLRRCYWWWSLAKKGQKSFLGRQMILHSPTLIGHVGNYRRLSVTKIIINKMGAGEYFFDSGCLVSCRVVRKVFNLRLIKSWCYPEAPLETRKEKSQRQIWVIPDTSFFCCCCFLRYTDSLDQQSDFFLLHSSKKDNVCPWRDLLNSVNI